MKKLLMAAAISLLPALLPVTAQAQSRGTLAGAAVGGVAGAAVGGPVGAAVGAVGGAVIGNKVVRECRAHRRAHYRHQRYYR